MSKSFSSWLCSLGLNPAPSGDPGDRFKKMNINIHDPQYAAWWCGASHASNAAAYHRDWDAFFRNAGRNPSKANALRHMDVLNKKWAKHDNCPPGTKTPV